jgi:SAM-dependent methyltransferase
MTTSRDQCPVCAASDIGEYYRKPYSEDPVRAFVISYYSLEARGKIAEYNRLTAGMDYALQQCKACNALFQTEVPSEFFAQTLYADWIKPGEVHEGDASQISFDGAKHYISEALKLTTLTLRSTGEARPGRLRVLDYGLGRGGFALAMKSCGCEVYGFDFAEDRQASGTRLGVKMLRASDLPSHRFHLINTEQVFEHLPHPLETARLLRESLAPGGLLKISVPFNKGVEKGDFTIDWSSGRYARRSPTPLQPLEHLQYFRRPSLDRLGDRLGLKRVSISRRDHLRFSFDWLSVRAAARNLGRSLAHERFRNYYVFRASP